VPMSPVGDEEEELSHEDVASMLHPMVAGRGPPKARKIEHVGALPSNMELLGVPTHVEKPKKTKKPNNAVLGTPGKAATATFLPGFVKKHLLGDSKHPAKKVKKHAGKKHVVKKHTEPMKPPSALDVLVAARKKEHVKEGKFDTVEEAVAMLKKRMLKKVKAKKAKENAKAEKANKKLSDVQKWLDHDEAVATGHVSHKAKQANEAAAQWLLKTKDAKGKAVDLRQLHELIHWHRVAASGGLSKDEIRHMVNRANKKHLPASTVVSQVTSANAKAAAFKAIQKKTTAKTSLYSRLQVADKAIADVADVAHMLDDKHRAKVAKVARHKVHGMLDLQIALEGRVADSVGLAAVRAGDFCETQWYRAVLLGKGCAEGN